MLNRKDSVWYFLDLTEASVFGLVRATTVMNELQLILIKWQLYVTSKKFSDKGVFPFDKGVKKWLFSLISVL